MKKYRATKKTMKPFSSLNRGDLLRGLNSSQEDAGPPARRSTSTTELCRKLGVSLSILGPSSSSSSSDLMEGVKVIEKASWEKKPEEVSAGKNAGKTDFVQMYYREIGVPLSAIAPGESIDSRPFEYLELLRDVSLEKLNSSVDASVKKSIQKTLGDTSKYVILSKDSSTASCSVKSTDHLLPRDSLPRPTSMRLRSFSEPLVKSDDHSMTSNNPLLTSVDFLGEYVVGESSQSSSLMPLRSNSWVLMKSDDQSTKSCNSGSTSALLSTLFRQSSDGSSQLMHGSIGSFSGPFLTSDDQSMRFDRLRALWGGSTGASSVPCDLPTKKPKVVTSKAITGKPDIQKIDANALPTILAIAARNKEAANKDPVKEAPSRKISCCNNTKLGEQYFEKSKKDVIFGRGTGPNVHNTFFRAEAAKYRTDYMAGHNAEQLTIVLGLLNFVKHDGGRFLKQDPITKQWYEIAEKDSFTKIRQMIREHKTAKQRQQSTKSKKKAAPKKLGKQRSTPILSQVLAS